MGHRLLAIVTVTMLLGPTVGCLGPRRNDYVSSGPVQLADPSVDADRAWEAIQETLRRHRYPLDRVDRRAGVVTTMPATSQHFFEVWRHDVDTWPDFWEATFNPIRRWVEVMITRAEDRSWSQVAVVVHKERFSAPDRQFNSTGAVYEYFGTALPSTTGLAQIAPELERWIDAGRDAAREEHLLHAILDRAGLPRAQPLAD